MKTAKQEVREMLETLPDNVSYEEIQYHLYVHQKIERSLQDVDEGRVLDQDEVEKRMERWLGA